MKTFTCRSFFGEKLCDCVLSISIYIYIFIYIYIYLYGPCVKSGSRCKTEATAHLRKGHSVHTASSVLL